MYRVSCESDENCTVGEALMQKLKNADKRDTQTEGGSKSVIEREREDSE